MDGYYWNTGVYVDVENRGIESGSDSGADNAR